MNSRTLLLPVALLAACAGAPAAPSKPVAAGGGAADYFPLAVGNEWIWDDVSPQLPAGGRKSARTVRIVERTSDGYFRDNERTELRADGECVRDRLRRLLCAPVQAGASWRSVVSVSSTERYEIVGVGEHGTPTASSDSGQRSRTSKISGTRLTRLIHQPESPT